MKKIWVYLLGVLTGVVLTFVVAYVVVSVQQRNNPTGTEQRRNTPTLQGAIFFEQAGEVIEPSSVKVFQVLGKGTALADCKGTTMSYSGTTVLFYSSDGDLYYDDQIVKAPEGKCFRQVGIYQYKTKMDLQKTVPIVAIMDK